MADDEFHAVGGELVGDRHAFLGVGAIIADADRSFWPRMPPPALMSSIACSAPFLIWAPKAALPPVIGAPTPNLTSALAPALDAIITAPQARAKAQLPCRSRAISIALSLSRDRRCGRIYVRSGRK